MLRAGRDLVCLGLMLSACSSCSTYLVREPFLASASAPTSGPASRPARALAATSAPARASAPTSASAAPASDAASAYGEAVGTSGERQAERVRPDKRAKTKAGGGGAKAKSTSDSQHRPTPDVGTPEWEAQKAEEARQQKQLDNALKSICRGC
jgi:hypothetical protein